MLLQLWVRVLGRNLELEHRQKINLTLRMLVGPSDCIAGHIWGGIAGAISSAKTAQGLCGCNYLALQHKQGY